MDVDDHKDRVQVKPYAIIGLLVALILYFGALSAYFLYSMEKMPIRLAASDQTMRMADSMRFTFKASVLNHRAFESYLTALNNQDKEMAFEALDYMKASLGFIYSNFIDNKPLIELVVPIIKENINLIESNMLSISNNKFDLLRKNFKKIQWETEQQEKRIYFDFQANYVKFTTSEYRLRLTYQIAAFTSLLFFVVIFVSFHKQRKLNRLIIKDELRLKELITLRNAELQELQKTKLEADAANKAKSDFLASMSHELRTPLNAVLGFAQMLELDPDNPLSPKQKEHIRCISEGGNHLLKLVNEILDLSRIEANQAEIFLENVDANVVVAECVNLLSPLGEKSSIKIINHFHDGPVTHILTDYSRLKQILLNLFSNAIKFNRNGGTVQVDGHETEDSFLRISVTDTGIGIAKKDYPNVFKIFHRLGANPQITQEGTGIGLNVTKLLVERMSGRIGFESEEGVGSTFWIELPMASSRGT